MKTLSKLVIERISAYSDKRHQRKPTASTILNDERLNAFPLYSGRIKRCAFSYANSTLY